jgi:hypothetical protein
VVITPVDFFIPRVKKSEQAAAYEAMIAAIKYQFNWRVNERRVMSMTYLHDRRTVVARVGEREQFEHHFEIVAIFEAAMYLVVTRLPNGNPGPTILVNNAEVTEVVDFLAA